ncbi:MULTISPECIES: DNA alkylation repair protein [unclassified Microbacterium]|uniref:DNA alkylation repair protein n=1 Tax=unclassified Microbacterium TaxID=2609290 RepID=UPI00214B76FB|nr:MULTISPECIES: DNA alkylation repair protein [unclassified Microbacterium]MCR2811066.1 DNA alkylation repair protein [Microbacterium sp. zg.B185]WIM17682.1 DNA alkylation repair protein [Microbacterium sp. zg-B185]
MSELADRIRAALHSAADPTRAAGQQAYMKSTIPFRGVRLPDVRRLTRAAVESAGAADPAALRDAARELWDDAEYREERYAAAALLAVDGAAADAAVVPIIEHMVRTGRWWDYTDELSHRLAALHDREPAATADLVRRWSTDPDMWIRRIAIISQLGRRDRVDLDLLAAVIEPNLADREFFIRKAIGWALRECARVHPEWVRAYAETHELSPLSRREALKHL